MVAEVVEERADVAALLAEVIVEVRVVLNQEILVGESGPRLFTQFRVSIVFDSFADVHLTINRSKRVSLRDCGLFEPSVSTTLASYSLAPQQREAQRYRRAIVIAFATRSSAFITSLAAVRSQAQLAKSVPESTQPAEPSNNPCSGAA